MVLNKWIKCADDNYFISPRDLVAVPMDNKIFYYSRNDCPYGWNVLVDIGAMFFPVSEAPLTHYINLFDLLSEDEILNKINSHLIDYITVNENNTINVDYVKFFDEQFEVSIFKITDNCLFELEKIVDDRISDWIEQGLI